MRWCDGARPRADRPAKDRVDGLPPRSTRTCGEEPGVVLQPARLRTTIRSGGRPLARLHKEQQALARWMTRMIRAFHAMEKNHPLIVEARRRWVAVGWDPPAEDVA
jgi:hypothetical protein